MKSKSHHEEDLMVARRIASAVYFTAHLRLGPLEKHTTRDLPTYEAAVEEAARLTVEHGRFGKRGVVYAVDPKGIEELCTPELVALARSLS